MQILIVDDEPLAREELHYLLEQNKLVTGIAEADSVESAQKELLQQNFDLIYLDIELGEESGFVLAKKLKEISCRPRIIFATAYNQYALDAFEVNAIDYILKPFEQKRVNQSLEKVVSFISEKTSISQNNQLISITTDDKTAIIKKDDIILVYVEAGYLKLVTKQKTFKSRQTLMHFASLLEPQKFMQVHRSFIINIDEIVMAEPSFNNTYQLTMSNQEKVPVARSYVNKMKLSLNM